MRLLRLENDQIEANFDSESTLVESIRERGKEDNEPDQFEIAFVAGPAQDGKGDIFSNLPPNLVHQIVHYLDQLDMVRCQGCDIANSESLKSKWDLPSLTRLPLRSRSDGVQNFIGNNKKIFA